MANVSCTWAGKAKSRKLAERNSVGSNAWSNHVVDWFTDQDGFAAFAAAQSDPGFTRSGCNDSMRS